MKKRAAKASATGARRRGRVCVALIGAGKMANEMHYPSLAERADVEMAALCDLDAAKLEKTAERFSIARRYSDYRRMLDEVKPDAVYCLMPPHQLFDVCVEVLNRKCALFVEKPLGINSFQARMLAARAAENGCVAMVGFNRRFAPLVAQARKAMDKAGGAQLCRAVFHKHASSVYYNGAIDALSSDAIHVVDLLRFMGGEVRSLEAAVSHFPVEGTPDTPNSWIAVLRFENGAVGELSAHWAAAARRLYCEMHNGKLSILCEPEVAMTIFDGDAKPRVVAAADAAGSGEKRLIGGYKQENDHFIECVKAGRRPLTNFADAAKSAELVERISRGAL